MKNKRVLTIAKIGVFSALSIALYFIRFPLPPFPNFLEIQFSNLPAIIGGFVLGPIGGLAIVLVKTIISFAFSTSQFVGEFADLLIGGSVVVATSLIYQKVKTRKGGVIALSIGIIVWVIAALVSNAFISVPFYMNVYGLKANDFISILNEIPWTSLFGTIGENNFMIVYLVCCTIPFNLILSFVVSVITFIVYKRISNFLKRFDEEKE